MRIVQFTKKSECNRTPILGVQVGGENGDLVDLSASGLPGTLTTLDLVQSGAKNLQKVKSFVDGLGDNQSRIPLKDVTLAPPIANPDKVICIGMNYKNHCEEINVPPPKEPVVFNKFPSCIVGPSSDIPLPAVTQELDWEVELAVVIGRKGRNVPREEAMDNVFGFTVAHDVSARDWQLRRNGGQWLVGKSMDSFCPLGPAIMTKEEVSDPHRLGLKCVVNGVTRQDSNTEQLIFKVDDIIAWCSKFFTLLPGDIILTGTPPGVGAFMKPPIFLKKGDKVECFIEGIGTIRNNIV